MNPLPQRLHPERAAIERRWPPVLAIDLCSCESDGPNHEKKPLLALCRTDATPLPQLFDADAAIATGEIRKLIPDLLAALGGELVIPGQ